MEEAGGEGSWASCILYCNEREKSWNETQRFDGRNGCCSTWRVVGGATGCLLMSGGGCVSSDETKRRRGMPRFSNISNDVRKKK